MSFELCGAEGHPRFLEPPIRYTQTCRNLEDTCSSFDLFQNCFLLNFVKFARPSDMCNNTKSKKNCVSLMRRSRDVQPGRKSCHVRFKICAKTQNRRKAVFLWWEDWLIHVQRGRTSRHVRFKIGYVCMYVCMHACKDQGSRIKDRMVVENALDLKKFPSAPTLGQRGSRP